MELPKNRRQTQVLRARTPAMEGPSPAMMPWRVRQFFCFFFFLAPFSAAGSGQRAQREEAGPRRVRQGQDDRRYAASRLPKVVKWGGVRWEMGKEHEQNVNVEGFTGIC